MSGSGTGTPITPVSGVTVQEILDTTFRRMGLGRVPATADYTHLLTGLKTMLRYWSSQKILVLSTVTETVSLVGSTGSYTWGSTGTISTTRPYRLVSVVARDSDGTDRNVEVISEEQYYRISNKSFSSSYPRVAFLKGDYPLAILYVWPVPEGTSYSLVICSLKPFTETGNFSSISDTLQFPAHYEALITNNLAVWMAPEYGKTVSQYVIDIANETYRTICSQNAAAQLAPVRLDDIIAMTSQGYFSVEIGDY